MRDWLVISTETAILLINWMALIIVVAGTVQAFLRGLVVLLLTRSGHERRDIWLSYARWLVAALTFQLAADIIETSITTDWQAVGKIAVVAVIRTFLNYFLERDLVEVRERQTEGRDALTSAGAS
ncbi:DUF1622 domain-containing protein [Rhizobium sp. LC145]|uniref:DUF1622 domain-containing protein n=1 Tax=Rhizobium sp. LC145 TaxID=1120688 RepID=UPI00062A309E|nr:DUF1622 domain-containing protein [Rhizobium sp. LC145]KKX23870.1 membrane protein [Rhizobium sp. LC145]TKT67084.1 DUF1622 domain-containing protein [Rhizobiaceae bacterium LC148]